MRMIVQERVRIFRKFNGFGIVIIYTCVSVQETDRGWYMCQINTDPMVHRSGYLEVVGRYMDRYIVYRY